MSNKVSHCESCGKANPGMEDGYTTCCNELICLGDHTYKFGTPEVFVKACCWGEAEKKFEALGISIPAGSYRF